MTSPTTSSSRKKPSSYVGRPHRKSTVRANNIEVLYRVILRLDRGEPLVTLISLLEELDLNRPHLKIKRRSRTILPQWRELGWREKELLRQMALERTGEATAFSLNLGNDLVAIHSYGNRPTRDALRDRMTRALRATFAYDVPFTMALEEALGGRLHIHGSVGVGPSRRPALEECLKRVGGKWGATHGGIFQVFLTDLSEPQGWAQYINKQHREGDGPPRKVVITKSRSMDALAKPLYDQMLQLLNHVGDDADALRVSYVTTIDSW